MLRNKLNIKSQYGFVRSCAINCFLILMILGCSFDKNANENTHLTVTCSFMGYTEGEDSPDYKIIKSSENISDRASREILVCFETDSADVAFHDLVGKCPICYEYTFTGDLLFEKERQVYIMHVNTFNVQLDNKCCNE